VKRQTVHVRVNDTDTGQPTPCRIRISDPGGQEYAPFGRSLNFSTNRGEDVGGQVRLGRERWFTIDGMCEIALPPGELRVQVHKGIRYVPVDHVIQQPPGKMSVRLELRRAQRTVQGTMDPRCHFASPHTALIDGAAEGLDVVNLLAEPVTTLGLDGISYPCVPNLLAFSGQDPALERHGTRVIVNTHHRHAVLGSLGLLHCHRVVHPLSFGPPDATDDWSLRDWAGQCHRKGGLVVWTEPFAANRPFAGEALALAILGEIDAFELSPDHLKSSLPAWYQLLHAGVDVPLVGSSGRTANDRPLGALQTATCNADFADDWVGTMKLGCGVPTNGPLANLWTDRDSAYASAISVTSFDRLELLVNGRVAATATPANQGSLYVAQLDVKVTPAAWMAARVIGTKPAHVGFGGPFAHTGTTRIGEARREPAAVAMLKEHLLRSRDWVETEGRFDEPKFRKQLLDTFDEATARLDQPPAAAP